MLWRQRCWLSLGYGLRRVQLADNGGSPSYTLRILHGFAGSEKLDQRIEYVASDWSLVRSAEHAVVETADTRRLSVEEEAGLFRRMNFLKHRAERPCDS